MSTRSTIACGDDWHFYHEAWENDCAYLEFSGGDQRVCVRIPDYVWAVIREKWPIDLRFAGKSDEEVKVHITDVVSQRVKDWNNRIQKTMEDDNLSREHAEERHAINGMCGCIQFGSMGDPEENQIKSGLEYYLQERDRQNEVYAKIKAAKNW